MQGPVRHEGSRRQGQSAPAGGVDAMCHSVTSTERSSLRTHTHTRPVITTDWRQNSRNKKKTPLETKAVPRRSSWNWMWNPASHAQTSTKSTCHRNLSTSPCPDYITGLNIRCNISQYGVTSRPFQTHTQRGVSREKALSIGRSRGDFGGVGSTEGINQPEAPGPEPNPALTPGLREEGVARWRGLHSRREVKHSRDCRTGEAWLRHQKKNETGF